MSAVTYFCIVLFPHKLVLRSFEPVTAIFRNIIQNENAHYMTSTLKFDV